MPPFSPPAYPKGFDLKKFITAQNKQNASLLFSYIIETPSASLFLLTQRETGFSITIRIENKRRQLTVQSFNLTSDKKLEEKSETLYDAAILEIVLQALEAIYKMADSFQKKDIRFALSQTDAHHLLPFDSLFHSVTYWENKVSFTLPTCLKSFELFKTNTSLIGEKICHELWQEQKEDKMIRTYLQTPGKGQDLFLVSREKNLLEDCQIIPFPFQENFLKKGKE